MTGFAKRRSSVLATCQRCRRLEPNQLLTVYPKRQRGSLYVHFRRANLPPRGDLRGRISRRDWALQYQLPDDNSATTYTVGAPGTDSLPQIILGNKLFSGAWPRL